MSLSHHLPEIHKIKRCIMGNGAAAARRDPTATLTVRDSRREGWNQPVGETGEKAEPQTAFGAK